MELFYWPAETKWGLPSFDITSLHALAYVKFSNADVTLKPSKRTWLSKEGQTLPSLYTPSKDKIEGTDDIMHYLKLKYYNPDTWMSKEDKQNCLPFLSMIEEKLLPAVKACFWLDNQNYTEITRGLYASSCQYPLNFTVPQNIQRSYNDFIQVTKAYDDEEMTRVPEKLHPDAALTLNLLSEFLGEKDFLFGDRPSSVDALLFSCLAPLLKIPLLSSTKLQNYLKGGCSNLCQYIARILQNDFKEELRSPVSSQDKESTDDEEDWKNDWIFPVCVATVAMVSYAVSAGLLRTTRV